MSPDIKAIMQALFDKGLAHIRKQGRPSFGADATQCRYRGLDNDACIVGGLIPDDRYYGALDDVEGLTSGMPASDSRVMDCIPELDGMASGDRLKVSRLLVTMQRECHDNPADGSNFLERVEAAARRVADQFYLRYTPPAAGAGT